MASANRFRRVEFNTSGIVQRGVRAVSRAMDQILPIMTTSIRDAITKKGYPPASRPGQFPHTRTGKLAESTSVERKGRRLFVRTLQYGIWLQGGTSKMLARKFYQEILFVPGAKSNKLRPKWIKLINQQTRKLVKRK